MNGQRHHQRSGRVQLTNHGVIINSFHSCSSGEVFVYSICIFFASGLAELTALAEKDEPVFIQQLRESWTVSSCNNEYAECISTVSVQAHARLID